MPSKIPHETIDAIDNKVGIEQGKSTYDRVAELYEINKAFIYNEIDEATMRARLREWWERGA